MESTNHPFGKENYLSNLQGMMFQPLIFKGVPMVTPPKFNIAPEN